MPLGRAHVRVHYEEALAELEERALGTLDLVVEELDRAMEAVEQRDPELADLVIADDDRVDGRYLEVHQGLINLIATQAPVASDLRLISALLYAMKCIERMGDQCVNIAKLVPVVDAGHPADGRMLERILTMGKQGRSMTRQVKRAFAERDRALAMDLVRQDDVIDRANRECFQIAVEVGDSPERREWAMTMLLMARALERIGDNTVDIGEQIAYIVTGEFQEFEDASRPDAPLPQPPPAE
jgi:phosphate transport system protein